MGPGNCEGCDEACERNDDGECLGNLTPEEREAVIKYLIEEANGKAN